MKKISLLALTALLFNTALAITPQELLKKASSSGLKPLPEGPL